MPSFFYEEDDFVAIEYTDNSRFMELTEQFANLYDKALKELAK